MTPKIVPVFRSIGRRHYTAVYGDRRLEVYERGAGVYYWCISDDTTGAIYTHGHADNRELALAVARKAVMR